MYTCLLMWYQVIYVCVALLWLSIFVLLCIVNTIAYYMYFVYIVRNGPWLVNKTYSILFYGPCLSCFLVSSLQPCGHLLGNGWSLGSFVYYVLLCFKFVTFPRGVLGQVCYLIVSIPDLCLLTYFHRIALIYRRIAVKAVEDIKSSFCQTKLRQE